MSGPAEPPEGEPDEPVDDSVIGRAFRRSLAVLAVLGLLVGGVAWWRTRAPAPVAPPVAVPLSAPPSVTAGEPGAPNLPFADATDAVGLHFERFNGARGERLLPETMGGGVTLFDFDADGDADVLLPNGDAWPGDPAPAQIRTKAPTLALWRNDAGRFTDITEAAGLNVSFQGMGAYAADVDGDRRPEILLTGVGGVRLLRSTDGRYHDATGESGLGALQGLWTTAAVFFDADGDADLDLAVAEYVQWSRAADLAIASTLDGKTRAYGPPNQFPGGSPRLFLNDGAGRFTDATETAGLRVKNTATGAPLAKSLGMIAADVDADGRLDLVVANDTVQNFVFRNLGGGRFEELGVRLGVAFDGNGRARGGMGIDAADFRGDGGLGVVIGNFANEMSALYTRGPGDAEFVDAAQAEGLGAPSRRTLKFGAFFFDADLDGYLDLLHANGHLEPEIARYQAGQTYAQPAQLFHHRGAAAGPTFHVLAAEAVGDLSRPVVGRGAAYADFDGDGDLDVFIAQPAGPLRVLRNEQRSGHHWLRIRLRGAPPNTDALGARITLKTAGRTQSRLVMPFASYLSQVESTATFGLGTSTRVEALTVRWPRGAEQVVPVEGVDRVLVVDEP